MKLTARDPKQFGLPIGMQFSSIRDLALGSNLKEDTESPPYADDEGRVHIYLKSESKEAACPYCGEISNHNHGIVFRNVQWLPLNGSPTVAHIKLRRYKCKNPQCECKTFIEEIPELSAFRQNSDVVLVVVFAISIFCSASGTELICRHLGIQISHDTINRLYFHIVMDDDSDIEEIGVDDVSRRRGMEYNTAIYDSNTHRLLALLDGRDGKELKRWLEQHPKIQKVARDRASAYATAIREILGNCVQVADRFHLLQNLMGRIIDLFKTSCPETLCIDLKGNIKDMPEKSEKQGYISHVDPDIYEEMKYNNDPIIDEEGKPVTVLVTEDCDKLANSRFQKMQKVMDLKNELNNTEQPDFKALSEKFGMIITTIKKYNQWTEEQVKTISDKKRFSKPNCPMNQYDNIVYKMLRDGISPDEVYCRILALGYTKSLYVLRSHISGIAYNHFGIKCNRKLGKVLVIPSDRIIKRVDIVKYITIRDKEKIKETTVAKNYDSIVAKYPYIKKIQEIWDDGYSMVMGGDKSKVDDFIDKYKGSEISPFVTGLEMDIEAVKNGVTEKMSSGFVEGNNCKYKLIKRTMYGRASTATLMKKFYVASKISRCNISITDILQLKTTRKHHSRRPLRTSC